MLPGVFFSFSALGLSMRGTDSKNLLWETETTLRAFRLKGDNSDRAYFFSSIGSSVHTLAIKMASCIKKKKSKPRLYQKQPDAVFISSLQARFSF